MSGVPVTVCTSCGWRGFPARVWCPACGSAGLETVLVTAGTVEARTIVRKASGRMIAEPLALATVALAGGGRVVARVEDIGNGEVTVGLEGGALVVRGGPEPDTERGGRR